MRNLNDKLYIGIFFILKISSYSRVIILSSSDMNWSWVITFTRLNLSLLRLWYAKIPNKWVLHICATILLNFIHWKSMFLKWKKKKTYTNLPMWFYLVFVYQQHRIRQREKKNPNISIVLTWFLLRRSFCYELKKKYISLQLFICNVISTMFTNNILKKEFYTEKRSKEMRIKWFISEYLASAKTKEFLSLSLLWHSLSFFFLLSPTKKVTMSIWIL